MGLLEFVLLLLRNLSPGPSPVERGDLTVDISGKK